MMSSRPEVVGQEFYRKDFVTLLTHNSKEFLWIHTLRGCRVRPGFLQGLHSCTDCMHHCNARDQGKDWMELIPLAYLLATGLRLTDDFSARGFSFTRRERRRETTRNNIHEHLRI